jgi:alpha-galactosidase
MKITGNSLLLIAVAAASVFLAVSCSDARKTVTSGSLKFEVDNQMYTLVTDNSAIKPLMTGFQASEYIVAEADTIRDFKLEKATAGKTNDFAGKGKRRIFTGTATLNGVILVKVLSVKTYDEMPGWAFTDVYYINHGDRDIIINAWNNHNYLIESNSDKPAFWSFQASSTEKRKSWVLPVDTGFYQKNYLGMNDPDYGGGIPVLDLWRKDGGIAIGHTSLQPEAVSLPVNMLKDKSFAQIGINYELPVADTLHPGDTLKTLSTFVTVHHGDYFGTLKDYSLFMQKKGIVLPPSEPLAFEPMWCAWGYMRGFTVDEVIGTLPKVKELGFTWVTVDDGYQQAEGDWQPNPKKFPAGDADMKKLVDAIHNAGFKAQLWWAPLAVDPGTKLLAQHPDLILKNADGNPQVISWWDSYYMSPAYQPVLDHTKAMVEMFLGNWGFDGLKLDGQHLNACPPDFNPAHNLKNPYDAPRQMPVVFKTIYETARSIKPDALVQLCPCGDAMSFYNIPYTNQFVASDPVGSTQVRSKGKTFKAIAPNTAYFGDHVELSDGRDDFASTIGVGGVPGTKFTWPKDNPTSSEKNLLNPERENEWAKWINIYKAHMLSKGEYLGGLYDIGYDIPETHVIRKGDTLFYAFYARDWKGEIKLRGLEKEQYEVTDYVNGQIKETVKKENPVISAAFEKYLLLMAYPVSDKQ